MCQYRMGRGKLRMRKGCKNFQIFHQSTLQKFYGGRVSVSLLLFSYKKSQPSNFNVVYIILCVLYASFFASGSWCLCFSFCWYNNGLIAISRLKRIKLAEYLFILSFSSQKVKFIDKYCLSMTLVWILHIAFGIVNQKPILAKPHSLPRVLFLFNKTNVLYSFTCSSSSSPTAFPVHLLGEASVIAVAVINGPYRNGF